MQTSNFVLEFLIGMTPTFLFLLFIGLTYIRGKKKNEKLVLKVINNLQEYFTAIATEFIQVNKTPAGYTYGLTLKKPSEDENDPLRFIRRMRIHFSLEDRQNFITFFKLLFKKPKDYFIIEGDTIVKNDHLKLEIAEKSSFGKYDLQKISKEWDDLVDFEAHSQFSEKFFHKTNYSKALKHIYDTETDLKKLIYNLSGLYRISLKRKEDWGFRIAMVIHHSDKNQFTIAREVGLRFLRGINEINVAISKQPKRFIS